MTRDQKKPLKNFMGLWMILGTVLVCIAAVVSGKSISRIFRDNPVPGVESDSAIGQEDNLPSDNTNEAIDRDLLLICDALEFITIQGDPAPEESTSETGSYYCIYNYKITNSHPETSVKITWKHMDSTVDTGPYWGHPDLLPGATYEIRLYKNKTVNDIWNWVDANYLMAWFDTEECNTYLANYRGSDEDPDYILKSGLDRFVLTNPCAPE